MKTITFDYWINSKDYIFVKAWGQKNQLGKMKVVKLLWDEKLKIPVEVADDIERTALNELNRESV